MLDLKNCSNAKRYMKEIGLTLDEAVGKLEKEEKARQHDETS